MDCLLFGFFFFLHKQCNVYLMSTWRTDMIFTVKHFLWLSWVSSQEIKESCNLMCINRISSTTLFFVPIYQEISSYQCSKKKKNHTCRISPPFPLKIYDDKHNRVILTVAAMSIQKKLSKYSNPNILSWNFLDFILFGICLQRYSFYCDPFNIHNKEINLPLIQI